MRPLNPQFQYLAWVLLNFLWQGLILWGVTALALRLTRRSRTRYFVACAGLAACVAWPVAAFLAGRPSGADVFRPIQEVGQGALAFVASGHSVLPWDQRLRVGLQPYLPRLFSLWAAGALILGLRFLGGWAWVQRLRWAGLTPSPALQARVDTLARGHGLSRAVRLRISSLVDMPVVLGVVRPVMLIPVAVATGLSPQALDMILVHELSHVLRHDYLVNLLQGAAEILLFYHPAVWWISRRIRTEREICCDDAAVAFGGDPVSYAHTLNRLDDLRTPTPAMAAGGGNVMLRIKRLLMARPEPIRVPWAGLLCAGALSVICGAGLWAKQADGSVKAKAQAPRQVKGVATTSVQAKPADDKTAVKVQVEEGDGGAVVVTGEALPGMTYTMREFPPAATLEGQSKKYTLRDAPGSPLRAEIPGVLQLAKPATTFSRLLRFRWNQGKVNINVYNLTHEEILSCLKKIDRLAEGHQDKGFFSGSWSLGTGTEGEPANGNYKTFDLDGVSTADIRAIL